MNDPIDITPAQGAQSCIWRWGDGGGVEDLKKARLYIDMLIMKMEAEGNGGSAEY